MAFDFDIAISKLAMGGADYDTGASTANLAARYPELDFIFHKLEEQAAVVSDMAPASDLREAERERDVMESAVTELTHRLQHMSQMIGVLVQLYPKDKDIAYLAKYTSDAVLYGEAV